MEKKRANSCSFTGHRPSKLPKGEELVKLKQLLCRCIEQMITTKGVCHFISGMAIGVDMIAAELVLEMKKTYPAITLEAAIPCNHQDFRWSNSQKKRYNTIISNADFVTVLQNEYTPDCMMKRNLYMVDKADNLIAVWDGSSGGTMNTVRFAVNQKKDGREINILRIDPVSLTAENFSRLPSPDDHQIKLFD